MNGARTGSGLPANSLLPADLVAKTKPARDGNGIILQHALRVNGAAVKPVRASGNCVESLTTGNGDYPSES